jgi:hypothetical protein
MTINLNEIPRGGTICLSKAGLGIGSTDKKTLSITAPNGAGVDFAINGVLYHKADAADALAITAATEQPVLTKCIYMVLLNSSGTLSTVKGTEQLITDLTAGTKVLDFPAPTKDTCCIGYFTISLASAATFTAATTALNAADVTAAYVDLVAVPVSPLTS